VETPGADGLMIVGTKERIVYALDSRTGKTGSAGVPPAKKTVVKPFF
jgi:hypothetical protein